MPVMNGMCGEPGGRGAVDFFVMAETVVLMRIAAAREISAMNQISITL